MSEPFSAAASAVGVISLGLQVCQHLVTYCQAYKSYDDDVRKISSIAQGLRQPLKDLRDLIEETQATDPEIAADLGEKAFSLQGTIDVLGKTVDRMQAAMPNDFSAVVKGSLNKALHPFRRSTLKEMVHDLNGMQTVLQTTLNIYSTRKIKRFEVKQDTLLEKVKQMHLDIQAIPRGQMPSPSLIVAWGKCHTNCAQLIQDTGIKQRNGPTEFGHEDPQIPTLTSSSEQQQQHLTKYRKKVLVKTYRYVSAVMRVAIAVSFSMSTGAGGLSIAPSLTFQATLDFYGSFAGQLIDEAIPLFYKSAAQFDKDIISLMARLQRGFDEGKAAPSDLYTQGDRDEAFSLVDAFLLSDGFNDRKKLPSLRMFIKFLINCGALPSNSSPEGSFQIFLRATVFDEEDYSFACFLAHHGGPAIYESSDLRFAERLNIQYILSRDQNWLSVPSPARAILQESEQELRSGLQSGGISANDQILGHSPLYVSIGWPEGIQILLDAGGNLQGDELSFLAWMRPNEESPLFDRYYQSYQILLDAGCTFNVGWLDQVDDSPLLQTLLIDELAKRRRALSRLARSYLPEDQAQAFELHEGSLPDIHAANICKAIRARGKSVHPSLLVDTQTSSVYHQRWSSATALDKLYEAGFRDYNARNSAGLFPIAMAGESYYLTESRVEGLEVILWFASKEEDALEKRPHSRSSTTVAHLLGALISAYTFHAAVGYADFHHEPHFQGLKVLVSRHRNKLFPLPSIHDNCTCSCSVSGCTILSVALRQILGLGHSTFHFVLSQGQCSFWMQRLLECFVDWMDLGSFTNQALIRALTFDALGLKHTCCVELVHMNTPFYYLDSKCMNPKDPEEVAELIKENKPGVEILERLLVEFDEKFDELGLHLFEFLEGYWHTRMVEYLCECDPYDEEHDMGARSLGVFLQPEDGNPLDRISLLMWGRVNEVESVGSDWETSSVISDPDEEAVSGAPENED